jgi:hypothetical protein
VGPIVSQSTSPPSLTWTPHASPWMGDDLPTNREARVDQVREWPAVRTGLDPDHLEARPVCSTRQQTHCTPSRSLMAAARTFTALATNRTHGDRWTVTNGCARLRFSPEADTHFTRRCRSDRLPYAILFPLAGRLRDRPPVGHVRGTNCQGYGDIPLTMSGRSLSCQRPPCVAAGITSSTMAYALSVPSDGDARRWLPQRLVRLLLRWLSCGFFLSAPCCLSAHTLRSLYAKRACVQWEHEEDKDRSSSDSSPSNAETPIPPESRHELQTLSP